MPAKKNLSSFRGRGRRHLSFLILSNSLLQTMHLLPVRIFHKNVSKFPNVSRLSYDLKKMQAVKLLHGIKYCYIKLMQVFYQHKVINTLIMEKHQERYHRTMRLVLALKGITCPGVSLIIQKTK